MLKKLSFLVSITILTAVIGCSSTQKNNPSHVADSGISDDCREEALGLPDDDNFDFMNFAKNLVPTRLKIKGKDAIAGLPVIGGMFGPGPDDKKTEIGLSVGCVRQLPEDVGSLVSFVKELTPDIAKGVAAKNLGVNRSEIPQDFDEIKKFAVKKSREILSENLKIEPEDIPEEPQELMKFIQKEIKSKEDAKQLLAVVGLAIGLDMLDKIDGGSKSKKQKD